MSTPTSTLPPLEPLPQQLLHYVGTYKALICTACQYAIQPNAISRHLKDIHKIHRARRRPFMTYTSTLDLASAEDIIALQCQLQVFPVPGLPIVGGFECGYDGCGHLCASLKRMKSHWNGVHGVVAEKECWKAVRLQTFFRGNLLRYFTSKSGCHDSILDFQHKRTCEVRIDEGNAIGQDRSPVSDCQQLDLSDSFLLDHFITSTSLTLSTDDGILWRNTVPLLATDQPFLYHGILCCTAFHLAYLYPAHRSGFILLATQHQDKAMPLFQKTMLAVTSQNCDAVLAYAHLLVVISFAAEAEDDKFLLITPPSTPIPIAVVGGHHNPQAPIAETIVPPWLYLLRTGCSIMCDIWDHLEAGPVRHLATQWGIPMTPLVEEPTPLLAHFMSLIPSSSQHLCPTWTAQENTSYTSAATELELAFRHKDTFGSRFTTWDALRVWPISLSDDFLDMLAGRHPGALVLLGYYCVLLKMVEVHWYFEGRAKRLLRDILGCLEGLEGGGRWREALRWVIQEVGSVY